MKFDKETTKLNAINMLSAIIEERQFVSPTEEMIYLSKKSNEIVKYTDKLGEKFIYMSMEDQLLLARTINILNDVQFQLVKKYGFIGDDEEEYYDAETT